MTRDTFGYRIDQAFNTFVGKLIVICALICCLHPIQLATVEPQIARDWGNWFIKSDITNPDITNLLKTDQKLR